MGFRETQISFVNRSNVFIFAAVRTKAQAQTILGKCADMDQPEWHNICNMRFRMDKSGRALLPKPLRKRLGLASECELQAVEQPGGILLRPVMQQPSMVQVDGLWIHQGTAEPGANWERVLNLVREERIQAVLKS
jgi:bifunctional DNA-binding transcriptional regulator/antitoxin component of YhaV-PrlF toxin-antitoxin module